MPWATGKGVALETTQGFENELRKAGEVGTRETTEVSRGQVSHLGHSHRTVGL